ncbi:MAG TPA: TetR/AcrR family transcriptional regulator [Vicinamibacterales bacterium]|nr:TetR/AcrR family transcriptional regulator [Vicinamibacterales bacterium]HOG30305.1 TetR/AcrR family transcriptional regulator [Vicinamibacterales bacterium]HOQ61731.1 TetR/AcrR family transcriptional regulator [Vicinamibacterales bacterium]HPK72206.1 TetR/AcrR family transcriptional regulator [Vicinamibacterales bacterium]HPW21773.1 TetR/AcrR family transcriptional regulator [Vicinamibacterales bacterium]
MTVPASRARVRRPHAVEPGARERLLCAAVELFERKGYAAASVRDIVEQAGVAKPALYYYFRNKEGILLAALELVASELDRTLDRAASAPGSARARLAGLCTLLLVESRSHASLVRVAHAVFFSPRESLPPFDFRVFDRIVARHLRRIVGSGVARGEIRAEASRLITQAVQGLVMLAVGQHVGRRRGRLSPKDMRDLVDLVFDGAGAGPRPSKGASS